MIEREEKDDEEFDEEPEGGGRARLTCQACGYTWWEFTAEDEVEGAACPLCGSEDVIPV